MRSVFMAMGGKTEHKGTRAASKVNAIGNPERKRIRSDAPTAMAASSSTGRVPQLDRKFSVIHGKNQSYITESVQRGKAKLLVAISETMSSNHATLIDLLMAEVKAGDLQKPEAVKARDVLLAEE